MQFFLSLIGLCAAAYPNPIAGSDKIGCRDPAVLYNPNTKSYYMFSTGGGMKLFKAPALKGPWTQTGFVMPNCSIVDNPGRCELWAGDVALINGKYTLYYSASQLSSQNSVIGVATSPSMEQGTWTDHGVVIRSNGSLPMNAIDPNIINSGGLKFTYGSHWDGIFQLDMKDFKTPAQALPGRHLAGNTGRPAEGAFIYKSPDQPYFYLFFSDGKTIFNDGRPPAGKEYKIRVGRGNKATGPFYDKTGDNLLTKMDPVSGSIVLETHDNIYAPGGQSIFRDPVSKRDVMAYHYVKNDVGGGAIFGLNYLDFKSGWPVVVA